jgi:PAS domain S-box-containing protein
VSDPSGSAITWVSDPAGARERIGPAWSTWTGADPAVDLGDGWRRRVHPDDLPGYLRRTAQARADGEGWTESYRLRHADGTDRTVVEHAVAAGDRWVGVAVPDTAGAETPVAGSTDAGFRRLAEHAGDVIGRHTADGTWLWISPSVRRVAGYRPREVVGRHPRDVVHPDDAEALDTALAALTEDEPAELLLRLRRADGVHRWFAMHARLVRDERTGAVEMHTSQRDVTDQLVAEEELARFRGLADRAADLIAIAASDGTGLYVNPAGREMLGLPRTRPVAEVTMAGCVAPADRRRFDGVLAEMESAGTWAGPMRLVDTAGIVIPVWLAAAVHRDRRGRTAFYSVVAQDLRERRGGEPALQAERERYRSLVAQVPVGIWVGDRTGATTFVNDHMIELTGRDLPGLAGLEHVHVDDREAVAAGWDAAVAAGSRWQHEFRIVTPAGDERVVTTTSRPLHDATGAVTGFLGTTTHVTGQRAAERDRREAAGRAPGVRRRRRPAPRDGRGARRDRVGGRVGPRTGRAAVHVRLRPGRGAAGPSRPPLDRRPGLLARADPPRRPRDRAGVHRPAHLPRPGPRPHLPRVRRRRADRVAAPGRARRRGPGRHAAGAGPDRRRHRAEAGRAVLADPRRDRAPAR